MTTPQRTFVSSEARVRDKERFGPLLRAYGEAFGTALRWSYMELVVHRATRQEVRSSLITSGWRGSRPRTWCIEPSRGGPRGGVGGAAATV